MKVKELIEKLQKINQELDVYVYSEADEGIDKCWGVKLDTKGVLNEDGDVEGEVGTCGWHPFEGNKFEDGDKICVLGPNPKWYTCI